jgi:hypothetical protein
MRIKLKASGEPAFLKCKSSGVQHLTGSGKERAIVNRVSSGVLY